MFAWRSKWNVKPAFLLALVSVLLVAVPVSADRPIVVTVPHDIDYAVEPQLCPGIEVRNHEVYTERVTYSLDNEGNLLRLVVHVEGTDNFYNPANPDVVLSGYFVANFAINELTGEQSEYGVPYHITVPGYGTVLVTAGRWFPGGRMVGKNSYLDSKDMAQFCALMAGD